MDTLSTARGAMMVVASLLLIGGCDLDLGDDEREDAGGGGEGGEEEDGGETDCEDADEDADGTCDLIDLCNDAAGTHCFELGSSIAAIMSQNTIADGGRFAAFVDTDIKVGATLEVTQVEDRGPCMGEAGAEAQAYVLQVVEVNAVSTNPDVQAYLDAELLTELRAEGVKPAVRFLATGPDTAPQLQIAMMAGLAPGHVFALTDARTYSPKCGELGIDATIVGTGAMFRLDHATLDGVTDRIEGAGAEYSLYPVGG